MSCMIFFFFYNSPVLIILKFKVMHNYGHDCFEWQLPLAVCFWLQRPKCQTVGFRMVLRQLTICPIMEALSAVCMCKDTCTTQERRHRLWSYNAANYEPQGQTHLTSIPNSQWCHQSAFGHLQSPSLKVHSCVCRRLTNSLSSSQMPFWNHPSQSLYSRDKHHTWTHTRHRLPTPIHHPESSVQLAKCPLCPSVPLSVLFYFSKLTPEAESLLHALYPTHIHDEMHAKYKGKWAGLTDETPLLGRNWVHSVDANSELSTHYALS